MYKESLKKNIFFFHMAYFCRAWAESGDFTRNNCTCYNYPQSPLDRVYHNMERRPYMRGEQPISASRYCYTKQDHRHYLNHVEVRRLESFQRVSCLIGKVLLEQIGCERKVHNPKSAHRG